MYGLKIGCVNIQYSLTNFFGELVLKKSKRIIKVQKQKNQEPNNTILPESEKSKKNFSDRSEFVSFNF